MPTPVLSQPSTRAPAKVPSLKSRATTAPPKKRRVIRRRGRARGDLDSDDEIEREAATDSDSDQDDLSSSESVTDDSDTEPASEDVITHDRAHLPTPRNSKSPEAVVSDEVAKVGGDVPSFFAPSGDWSEMVTDEKVNGPADLPVIEFADFSGQSIPQNTPSRKPKKASKAKRLAESRATPADSAHEAPAPVSDRPDNTPVETETPTPHPNRVSSQSARQAYQHKLETDPSFVPTIGNFWGHDDRLIDTELRSLSGWWRGRGRGRGRGFAARGRGGFGGPQARGGEEPVIPKTEDLPPIERAWTHDGFEDMKRKEDKRRAEHQASTQEQASRNGGSVGARGGFVAGRGRAGFARGSFGSHITGRNASSFSQLGRVRFAGKPELVWTTQHEAFLFFDPSVKPRPGQGPTYRIKIPGQGSKTAKGPIVPRDAPKASTSKSVSEGSEAGDRYFVVRLPKRAGKEREVMVTEKREEETSLEEVFTVRPQIVATKSTLEQHAATIDLSAVPAATEGDVKVLLEPTVRSQLEQLSLEPHVPDPARQAKMEEAVLRNPIADVATVAEVSSVEDRPVLAPLQTGFTSPPLPSISQPLAQSPPFGSPYGYHPQLPPGVALNQHGMPYEVATGHPVYLQPPTMYTPRPLMPSHFTPSMTFIPTHMHHASAVSPDFLAQQPSAHTPPMNGFIDPATGTPIFSFPRQTSRIEIRAPTEESTGTKSKPAPRTPSGLRTTALSFQPTRPALPSEHGYYQHSASSDAGGSSYENAIGQTPNEDASRAGMSGMVTYPSYQQTYYYPEPYGYPQYVDMSQAGQYDMYNMEQGPQGTVYY